MGNSDCINRQVLGRLYKTVGDTVVKRLIRIFLETATVRIENSFNALKSKDFETIAMNAHSLISSSGSMGAVNITDLSAKIELDAMNQNETEILPLLSKLRSEFDRVKNELSKEVS